MEKVMRRAGEYVIPHEAVPEVMSRIKLPVNTKTTEVLVRHIRDAVQKDPVSSANVLRSWITDNDAKRTV